jgi:ankyrin repeat protein
MADILLKKGALVNDKTNAGLTPLMITSSADVATRLLQEGDADVNATDHTGKTALMHAAMKNATEVANRLLKHGADIYATDEDRRTALMHAASKEMEEFLSASDGSKKGL